ncbi:hypothetical protein PRN20_05790 [Devosia sp. ZB163]|uniref:hypothetical protein n=1 Tax=Devosia sp. ZB163 TaxID=3025938 RepID=UPI00235E4C7B|nr:hypothetical protein [Devosia sp. ZB163]MDC9823238.1 hypothetical protein [Devosia sp. ZB163]
MIARGSQDEQEAGRYIAHWQGMIAHWNNVADGYRNAARGRATASDELLDEADSTRRAIQQAHELADRLIENLPHGHDLRRDLFQVSAALEALSASVGISVDRMVPRIEANHDIAGLKYLLGALKRDAGLGA